MAELEATAAPSKKKKISQEENELEKVLSLCSDKNSLIAGMIYTYGSLSCYDLISYV